MSFHVPHEKRLVTGRLKSTSADGNNGVFQVQLNGVELWCMASDGMAWEHVSVSLKRKRCPNWEEMCFVKNTFWDEEDCVIQFHPPKKDYINNCGNCLHLWRPTSKLARLLIPRPPKILVGI